MKFDPYDIHQFDDLDALAAVLSAWDAQKDNPLMGNFAAVRTGFPVLAHSLDRLVSVMNQPDEAPAVDTIEFPISQETADLIRAATSLHFSEAASVLDEGDGEESKPSTEDDLADFVTDAAQFEVRGKSNEEIADRARLATDRLRSWGRKRAYRKAAIEEAALRLRLVVFLNNRDEMTQKKIAEAIGVSVARVTQLVGEYYNRLDYEQHIVKKRKR